MAGRIRALVCVAASDTLQGKLIRWIFKAPVNHAFVLYQSNDWETWEAIQISEKGVHKVFAKKIVESKTYTRVRVFEPAFDIWQGVLARCDYIDRPYDWKGAVAGVFKGLMIRLFRVYVDKVIHTRDALFCSEYVAEVIKASPGAPKMVCVDVGPGMMKQVVKPAEVAPHMLLQHWTLSDAYTEVDWGELSGKILQSGL